MSSTFTHPFVDYVEGRFACIQTRADVVFLSESLAGAVKDIVTAGLTPVIVTTPHARVTFATRYVLELAGAIWLLQFEDGLIVRGIGARVGSIRELEHAADAPRFDITSPASADAVHALFGVTVHHRADEHTRIGNLASTMTTELTGTAPTGWGVHEPAGLSWDVDEITAASRTFMPDGLRFLAVANTDRPVQTHTFAQRTASGVQETVNGLAVIGDAIGSLHQHTELLTRALIAIAETFPTPAVGVISIRHGWRHGMSTLQPEPATVPVAGLIGPRAVRDLGIDVQRFSDRFPTHVVGRHKLPSLVIPFLGADPTRAMNDVVDYLGSDRIRRAFRLDGAG